MLGTVRIKGIREFQRALDHADRELGKQLRRELYDAAKIVASDARARFSGIDASSAMGMRPRVRGRGMAVVEQSRRRTTGQHPQFGALQMRRALLPALVSKRGEVEHRVEVMLDHLVSQAEGGM